MPFIMENFIKYDNYGVIDLLSNRSLYSRFHCWLKLAKSFSLEKQNTFSFVLAAPYTPWSTHINGQEQRLGKTISELGSLITG